MEDKSITELPELIELADDDFLEVVDVSEPDPDKKNKKIKGENIGAGKFDAFVTSQAQGDIPAGTQMEGIKIIDAAKLMLSRPFNAMAVALSINNTLHEQGSTPTVTVTGTVSVNDENISITDRKLLRKIFPASVFTEWNTFGTNSITVNDTPTVETVYRIEALGGKSGLKSAERTVSFDLYHWYGPSATVPTATTARNLAGKIFKTQGNTFTLNTGAVERKFYILLAPGENLVSVIDQDALNLNITSEYALVNSNFSVNNAAGTAVAGYRLYEKVQGVPYASNHRHNITIS